MSLATPFVREVLNSLLRSLDETEMSADDLPKTRADLLSVIESYKSDSNFASSLLTTNDINTALTNELISDYLDVITIKTRLVG